MNGLICYRIAGGELTDIVASYDGFITIGQENDRNHTTKIPIAGSTDIRDVLNVAIQITTDGKSVLHKSTRIICKDGVITAYDLKMEELGDDTDWMIELSNAFTEYLTKPAVLVSDAIVPMERIEILLDKKLLQTLGDALGTYLTKTPVLVSDAVVSVDGIDIQSDDRLKTLGDALGTYLTKTPVLVSDAVVPMERNDIQPDGKLLQTLGDALGTYLKKTDVSVSDAVVPMGRIDVSQDKKLLQTLGDALGNYLKKPILQDTVERTEQMGEQVKPVITEKFFAFLQQKYERSGRPEDFKQLFKQIQSDKPDFANEETHYNFHYTGIINNKKSEEPPIQLPLSMHYKQDDFSYINNPAIFKIWKAINGEKVDIELEPSKLFCKKHLPKLASELRNKPLSDENYKTLQDIIRSNSHSVEVDLYIAMKQLLIDDAEFQLRLNEFIVKMLYYVYCIKDRVEEIQQHWLDDKELLSYSSDGIKLDEIDIGLVDIGEIIAKQNRIIVDRRNARIVLRKEVEREGKISPDGRRKYNTAKIKYTTDRQTLEETAKKYKQWKYSFSLPFELFEFRYGKIDYIDRNDPRARFIECIKIYIAKDEDEQPISDEEQDQIDALITEIGSGQFVGLQPDLVEP